MQATIGEGRGPRGERRAASGERRAASGEDGGTMQGASWILLKSEASEASGGCQPSTRTSTAAAFAAATASASSSFSLFSPPPSTTISSSCDLCIPAFPLSLPAPPLTLFHSAPSRTLLLTLLIPTLLLTLAFALNLPLTTQLTNQHETTLLLHSAVAATEAATAVATRLAAAVQCSGEGAERSSCGNSSRQNQWSDGSGLELLDAYEEHVAALLAAVEREGGNGGSSSHQEGDVGKAIKTEEMHADVASQAGEEVRQALQRLRDGAAALVSKLRGAAAKIGGSGGRDWGNGGEDAEKEEQGGGGGGGWAGRGSDKGMVTEESKQAHNVHVGNDDGVNLETKAAAVMRIWEASKDLDLLYSCCDGNGSTTADVASTGSSEPLGEHPAGSVVSAAAAAAVGRGPHLEDCEAREEERRQLDERQEDGSPPVWPLWNARLGLFTNLTWSNQEGFMEAGEELAPHPPWLSGSDEDNLPLTRQAQHDIWLNQHPKDCYAPGVKFVVVSCRNGRPFWGDGAQVLIISSALSLAMQSKRVMIIDAFNRAEHDGCQGPHYGLWSCYFAPEASQQCRERLREVLSDPQRKEQAIKEELILNVTLLGPNFHQFQFPISTQWGEPWRMVIPTMEAEDRLVESTKVDAMMWWHAQAIRYLMRYKSVRLCKLVNAARHKAFGADVAMQAAKALPLGWPDLGTREREPALLPPLLHVWHVHAPYVPEGLVSVHVRQGDKQREMKIKEFADYIRLLSRLRRRFPHADKAWLTTEMEDVVNDTKLYPQWKWFFTRVPRQGQAATMETYMGSLGIKDAADNAFVNLMMASECEFFVGVMGSTWSILIDSLRVTSGKVMRGFLSVNEFRFW